MKHQTKTSLLSLTSILVAMSLTGCNSMLSSRMPPDNISMEQAYNSAINGTNHINNNHSIKKIRTQVNNLNQQPPYYNAFTRTQKNEINSQFPQLPNPSIVMYVYPHEAGTGYNITPVPGYSTVFPLYQHVYYAMPGEVMAN